jgi:hypothetical protein
MATSVGALFLLGDESMNNCQWAGCNVRIQQAGRGRPRKYCDVHAAESKQQANRKWRAKPAAEVHIPPCCRDARLANPRCRICPQHQQWRRWLTDQRRAFGTRRDRDALAAFAAEYSPGAFGMDRNFRVAVNPDSWKSWEREEINIIGRESIS